MKLWKHTLISAIAFFGVSSTVLYTSCNDDACLKLKCRNGGTCADEYCKCPTGYEGTQCENKVADRYLGKYYGVTKINELPPFIDSALIELVKYPNIVEFKRFSRADDRITGTINASGVVFINNDPNYGGRQIVLTIDGSKLTFQSSEKRNDTLQQVNFTGSRK